MRRLCITYSVIPAKKRIHAIVLIFALTGNTFAGSVAYPPLDSIAGAPAQHSYRSLDFGISKINGQRIQIRSNAPAGSAVNTGQLDINNAGIQAGYIAPKSHFIPAGSSCSSDQMGMIAQQLNQNVLVNSQLQCMYNPTFCSSPGYCYLPIKTSTFTYTYKDPVISGQCPSGTIVDSIQPQDGVRTSASCPNMVGWILYQGAHGVGINGYTSSTGLSYFTGYETVCNYYDTNEAPQQVAIVALLKLQCTNASTTFTVDNYTP